MKNLIIILFCLTFQKVSCQIDTISLTSHGLKGKIRSIENKTYLAKDNLGTISKGQELDKDANFKIELENPKTNFFCEYNKNGKNIKQIVFRKEISLIETKNFEYKNDLIDKVKITLLTSGLTVSILEQYFYDSNKNLTETILYRFDELFNKTLLKYDKNDSIIKKEIIDNKGNIDKRKIYSYQNNKLIFEKKINNTYSSEKSLKYDSIGNLIFKNTKLTFNDDKDSPLILNTEYFYNDNNQLTKEVQIGGKLITTISYKYNSNGKLSSETEKNNNSFLEINYTYNSDKSKTIETHKKEETIIKKFNEYNNPVYYQHSFKNDNTIEYSYQYSYDKIGNWIKVIELKNTIPNKIRIRKIEYY